MRGLALIHIYPSDISSPNQPFKIIPLKTGVENTQCGRKKELFKFSNGYFMVLILLGSFSLPALHVLFFLCDLTPPSVSNKGTQQSKNKRFPGLLCKK